MKTQKIIKKGTIYIVQGLRPREITYNSFWHWSEKLGAYYTHSLIEVKKAGFEEKRIQ